MAGLIVSLDEFADLAGVTAETMRVHLRELLKDGAEGPAWLVERGDRGRAYKIEAEGGIRWWQAKRDADQAADAERSAQFQQLRLEIAGAGEKDPELLALSGRQRREEYGAAMEAIKYRKLLGQLLERDEVERVLGIAAIEHRRALMQVAPEFGIEAGLSADQVRALNARIERAVEQFVAAIAKPGAFDPEKNLAPAG